MAVDMYLCCLDNFPGAMSLARILSGNDLIDGSEWMPIREDYVLNGDKDWKWCFEPGDIEYRDHVPGVHEANTDGTVNIRWTPLWQDEEPDDGDVVEYRDNWPGVYTHQERDERGARLVRKFVQGGWENVQDRDEERGDGHPGFDCKPIGPYSGLKAAMDMDRKRWIPGPVEGLARVLTEPVVLTPAVASMIMTSLNVADRSHYRNWKKRGRGQHGFGRTRKPERRYHYRSDRVHKRQWIKRWLHENMGKIVWWEGW